MGAGSSKSEIKTLKATVSSLGNRLKTLESQTVDATVIRSIAKDLDYSKLGQNILYPKVTEELLKNPAKITQGLATQFTDKPETLTKIATSLADDTRFAKTLADTLTDSSTQYRRALQGDKGDAGELSSSKDVVKQTLYDKKYTLWCDDNVCKTPEGMKTLQIGSWRLEEVGNGNLHVYKGTDPHKWVTSYQPNDTVIKFGSGWILSGDGHVKLTKDGNNVHTWYADRNQSAHNNFQIVGNTLEISKPGENVEIKMGDYQHYGYGGGGAYVIRSGGSDQIKLIKNDFVEAKKLTATGKWWSH